MRKQILTALFFLLYINSIPAQQAQDFTGAWEGKLEVGGGLRLVFHLTATDNGTLTAVMDSPDQGGYGIPCDSAFVAGNQLHITMQALRASFTGTMNNDTTIEGKFKQGMELPLVLTRKKENKSVRITDTVHRASEVSVPVKQAVLSGTLFQPLNNSHSDVVLFIAGSGPTDRDGNSAGLPGKSNTLLQLADSLARHGIASLRYDKRGIGRSTLQEGLGEESMTFSESVSDAMALYEWLQKEGYKNIFIAGHSEGSLVGMIVAGKVKPGGFISLAGTGRKAGLILKEQVKGKLPARLEQEFGVALDSLEQGLTVSKVDSSLYFLLRPSVQPYMKSWLLLDPQQLITQLNCPVLIIQGTKDLQVPTTDAHLLHTAYPASRLLVIENMNHPLKEVLSDKRAENMSAYANPDMPVMKELVEALAAFVNNQGK